MAVALLEQQLVASLDGCSPRNKTFVVTAFSAVKSYQLSLKAMHLGPIAKRTYHSACHAALQPEPARNSFCK